MQHRIITAATLLFASVATWAQDFSAPRVPGQLMAVPQVRFANDAHRVAGKAQPKVVFADGQQPRRATAQRAIANADKALYEGRTIYGAMVNSNAWADCSITEVPYGIYTFTVSDTPQPEAKITDMSYNFMNGAWGRDRHYGIYVMNVMGVINGTRNITIDTKNWKETSNILVDRDKGTYSLVTTTMAYDPTDDNFYGYQYKEDLTGLNWVRINTETAELEQVAAYRGKTQVMALAADNKGQFYFVDAVGDFYSLNKSNGRSSLIGNTGVTVGAYNQAMTFDAKTGNFLWAAQSSEGSVLYAINPSTAETQRVMRFKNNEQFVSLYITDTEAPANAPAAVGRPQLKYSANGSLEGTITFTAPSKTYGGEVLNGDINLDVWLDGENLKGESIAAGSGSVSIPVTLTEGNHYVAITTDNEAGISPLRQIYQYAGYDTPVAVDKVTFEQKDGKNSLSWTKADVGVNAGINRGFIDGDALTYTIVRMPDSVTVATGLKVAEYEETTPDDMHLYYYRVTSDNNGHVSAYTESNRILCGNAFNVPYKQEFADPETLSDYFTVVDNDGDGNTWRQGYTTEVRMDYFKYADADDWLISPAIKLQTGNKYRFAMEMKIFTQQFPENFDVLVGKNPNDLSTFRVIKSERDFTDIANEFDYYKTDFLVDEDGEYHVAVRYCATKDSKSSLIMIRNFAVDLVGNALAPAQPTDMTVSPDADDELKATVTFTVPSLNLMGETGAELTKVVITRDGSDEILKTFDAPAAGTQLSWTDEAVPTVGLHTYTVKAVNAYGDGEPLSVEQFIGVYQAPYFTDFEDKKYGGLWTTESVNLDDPNGWYGWKWRDNDNTYGRYIGVDYYAMNANTIEMWMFSPKFKMEKDAVYTIKYDASMNYSLYPDVHYDMYMGPEASSKNMPEYIGVMPCTTYGMDPVELMVVNSEAGKYNIGFVAHGSTLYNWYNASIDNFSLTYRTSAFAPYEIGNYKNYADKTGALVANMSFVAPEVNYYKNKLDPTEELTIKVFRGRDASTLAFTTTAKPGAFVDWTDDNAQKGFNYYTIMCENKYGVSEKIVDTLYVGRDIPDLVENLKVRGSQDNKDAVITWDAPSWGMNGGIVLKDELSYNLYIYDINTQTSELVASDLKGTSYTVEREKGPQTLIYYSVSAIMETEGEGNALASGVILGDLYELPFHESFANAAVSTTLWQAVPVVQGATAAGIDNPTDNGYNGCTGPQDNDGGCAYIYNGYQSEIMTGAILSTPKMRLSTQTGNELRFWAYHFKEVYSENAYVQVIISDSDTPYAIVSGGKFNVGGVSDEGWKEHVIKLDKYKNSDYVSLGFLGVTGGYQDVIYIDNITVQNPNVSGITDIAGDYAVNNHRFYNLHGQRVNPNAHGIIITNGKKFLKK